MSELALNPLVDRCDGLRPWSGRAPSGLCSHLRDDSTSISRSSRIKASRLTARSVAALQHGDRLARLVDGRLNDSGGWLETVGERECLDFKVRLGRQGRATTFDLPGPLSRPVGRDVGPIVMA